MLRVFRSAVAAGIVGLALLAAAVATASLRYDRCGASTLAAAEPACRTGARLLFGAYGLLSIALVLGAVALTLLWQARRARRQA